MFWRHSGEEVRAGRGCIMQALYPISREEPGLQWPGGSGPEREGRRQFDLRGLVGDPGICRRRGERGGTGRGRRVERREEGEPVGAGCAETQALRIGCGEGSVSFTVGERSVRSGPEG